MTAETQPNDLTDSRSRLLDAATHLLSQRGYSGTAVKDVLEASDTVAGSLYHHFPGGKEDLAAAAVDRAGAWVRAIFATLFEDHGAAGAVDVYFKAIADRLEDTQFTDGCPIGTPSADAPVTARKVQEAAGAAFAGWQKAMVDQLVREGWTRPSARDLATNFVSLYEGAILVSRAERTTRPVKAAARLGRALIEAGPA